MRGGRPLLLIDLAVPRDIQPASREIAGASLYDMDDLQTLVERNLSGREAEARRVEGDPALRARPLRALARRPGRDPDDRRAARARRRGRRAGPGRERVALGGADRGRPRAARGGGAGDRLAAAARAHPAAQARRRGRRLLREGRACCASSSASTATASRSRRAGAEVSDLGERRRRQRQVSRLRLGSRGSALARIQAERVAAALGGAEVVTVRTADGDVGDKSRFVARDRARDPRRRGGDRRPLGQGPPGRAARRTGAGRRSRARGSQRRAHRRRRVARRARRGRPGRHLEPAPRAHSCSPLRPDLEIAELRGNVDTRLAKLEAGDYDAIVLATAGLRGSAARMRSRSGSGSSSSRRPRARAAWRSRPRAGDEAAAAAAAAISDRAALLELTAERAAVRALEASLRHAGRRLRALRGRRAGRARLRGLARRRVVGPRPGRGRSRAAGRARRGARRADARRGRPRDPRRAEAMPA